MLRISLLATAFYFSVLSSFSQAVVSTDSTSYQIRKLKFEEVNFLTSYYHQEGNNAAVTGGIGSEKLTDFATTIDVRLSKRDRKNRLHSFAAELGIDYYSSASSDKVDPLTISSASSSDVRIYPTLSWSVTNEEKKQTIGVNAAVSSEYDYLSTGAGILFSKDSKDNSRQFTARFQAYIDFVSLIYPVELRPGPESGQKSRNTFSGSFSLSQIINKRFQVALIADVALQQGFLSLPFNRVYFNDDSHFVETLPGTRIKLPIGVRASYFMGDRFILRAFYRYYTDDWGLRAHTLNLETPIKITPFISLSPFYRFYQQSAIDYFAPYKEHAAEENYFTSDYDLSKFTSHFGGISFRVVSPDGIFRIPHFNTIEVRYGHYDRSTGLIANIVTLQAKVK